MLSAFATDTKFVLARLYIDAKSNEIPASQALLAELGIGEDATSARFRGQLLPLDRTG